MHKLNAVYLAMLNTMWDIENQIIVQLPKILAEQIHAAELKEALAEYLAQTRDHKLRLEELLAHHNYSLTYERDISFEMLLQDIASNLSLITDPNVKDAFITASMTTVAHIAIARYQTLSGWAKELGDESGQEILKKTLAEEDHACKKLTAIAQGGLFTMGINEKAVITGEGDTSASSSG